MVLRQGEFLNGRPAFQNIAAAVLALVEEAQKSRSQSRLNRKARRLSRRVTYRQLSDLGLSRIDLEHISSDSLFKDYTLRDRRVN